MSQSAVLFRLKFRNTNSNNMKTFTNRIRLFLIAFALMLPVKGFCGTMHSNGVMCYTPYDIMRFLAMAVLVLVILLVFAVIFFSISHRTKREMMHLELLTDMVKQGMVPTAEQVREKRVVDGKISCDENGNVVVKKRIRISLPQIVFFLIGFVYLILAFYVNDDAAKMFAIVALYMMIYSIMEFCNARFLLKNIATFSIINIIIAIAVIITGCFIAPHLEEALYFCFIPGVYILYYGIRTMDNAGSLPRLEFKIRRADVPRDEATEKNVGNEADNAGTEQK